ncbi:hypothetical protein KBC79_05755 [Candidatus Woesebacteria bacterium]|nr:hypothetical protein [Candidatus Woesebacteria bacterium]
MFENANGYVPPGLADFDAANGQPDGVGAESDAANDQPDGAGADDGGAETEDRRPGYQIEIEQNQAAKTQEIANSLSALNQQFRVEQELGKLGKLVAAKEISPEQQQELQTLGAQRIEQLNFLDRQKAAAEKLLEQIQSEPLYITNVDTIALKATEAFSAGQISEEGLGKIKSKLDELLKHRKQVEAARKEREEQWRPVKSPVEAVAAPPVAPVEVPTAPVDVPTENPNIVSRFLSRFKR